MGRPGLIGSGPYMAAYLQIMAGLRELADTVMVAYTSKFSTLSSPDKCIIMEGDPLEVIRQFYPSHDRIIMGRSYSIENACAGRSLSQAITMDGVRPVTVVRENESCEWPVQYAEAV
jgi:hypothetical protein